MRSFSKTFNITLNKISIESKELMQAMNQVAQREEQLMMEKLMKQAEIQDRLKRMEQSYKLNALKKQQQIKLKLEKSQKNRHLFLDKIVKRCQDKQKMFAQKIKTNTSKRKQSLRQAWQAATKFNQKILEGRTMRHKSCERQHQTEHKIDSQQNLNKSLLIPDSVDEENKPQQNGMTMRNSNKPIDSGLANPSYLKSHDHMTFQSTFNIQKKLDKLSRPLPIVIQQRQVTQQNPENSYQQKLRKTLIRHQQFMIEEENKKIQEYGQRLEKINLSRRKKDELNKSRLKRSSLETQQDSYDDQNKKREQKLNAKHNKRLKSQTKSCNRVKRASDWSQLNKQRRQQLLNAHIEQGNQYLSENKLRFLKETMSKNIAYNALERKLYEQRIRNF